jgi:hypothetical protein
MKKWISSFVVFGAAIAAVGNVHARDTKLMLPIEPAMAVADSKDKLEGNVKFYFGDQKHPKVLTKLGSDSTSKKTNAFGKSDETACNWAFLSAMVQLEKRLSSLALMLSSISLATMSTMSTPVRPNSSAMLAGLWQAWP